MFGMLNRCVAELVTIVMFANQICSTMALTNLVYKDAKEVAIVRGW